jgi:hypothetical protein
VLNGVAIVHPQMQCMAVPLDDRKGGYELREAAHLSSRNTIWPPPTGARLFS